MNCNCSNPRTGGCPACNPQHYEPVKVLVNGLTPAEWELSQKLDRIIDLLERMAPKPSGHPEYGDPH